MTMVEMKVHMDCEGCVAKIKKALGKLKGVDSVDIDMEKQKVIVTGWAAADQKKILKKVRNTGRRAELWPYPYNSETQFYYEYYQMQPMSTITNYHATGRSSSYNYYKHGYDGHNHGYYYPPPYSTLIDEQASSVFSDENPHACSIM